MSSIPATQSTYVAIQPIGQLLGLVLSQVISGVRYENGGQHEVFGLVSHQLECLLSARKNFPASNQHAVDVKEQPKLKRILVDPEFL